MIIFLPVHLYKQDATRKFDIELRSRYERRTDRDFSAATNDNRSDLYTRVRIGTGFEFNGGWTGYAQYQFGSDLIWRLSGNKSDGSGDILQAFAEKKTDDYDFKVGRQRWKLGSERLIGVSDWTNRSRSFDGVRFANKKFDFFAGKIGVQDSAPMDARVAAISTDSHFGTTSLLFKHDSAAAGSVDIYTLDHSKSGKLFGFNYDFEFAGQAGRNGTREHRAWAYHTQVGKDLGSKASLSLKWDAASGGDTTDPTSHTFDNLYPTNHKFYGLMDMHAWKNMDQVAAELKYKFEPKVDLVGRVSRNWLHDSRDGWYRSNGTINQWSGGNFVDPTGSSGRDLGWEYDIEAQWKKSSNENVLLGVGVYKPGSFVSAFTGTTKQQVFGCLMYSLKF